MDFARKSLLGLVVGLVDVNGYMKSVTKSERSACAVYEAVAVVSILVRDFF